jgi:hypothetical protein
MSVAIEKVPMWLMLRQTGHALSAVLSSGWFITACGTLTPNGEKMSHLPDRICDKCRKRLQDAHLEIITPGRKTG